MPMAVAMENGKIPRCWASLHIEGIVGLRVIVKTLDNYVRNRACDSRL